ncbi:hypothetical protein D9611_013139 [Ephemerocybe angulata]|uniref:Uncharacterized protein n=1 Tax=Ephemerocybe angulata TaxID=980116 RepID=A0A8H5FCA7_9AGAR|nr:hypothetical protein D9611_013139 [Tulosesus angulatus]
MEEEAQEETQRKGDTARVDSSPKALPAPLAPALMEDRQQIQTGVDDAEDISQTSAITPRLPPPLPSSPMPTSSPLTLSQCFLPPSSPYTSPPPRSESPTTPLSDKRFWRRFLFPSSTAPLALLKSLWLVFCFLLCVVLVRLPLNPPLR